jgi:hypothetical protein
MSMVTYEADYRDHVLRYAVLAGDPLSSDEAIAKLQRAFPDAIALANTMMGCFSADALEAALGAPGEPGDAELIQHLARRTIDGYSQFLEWGCDLRATRVPSEFHTAFNLAADMMRTPVEEIRAYVNEVRSTMDDLADRLAARSNDDPLEMTISLTVTVDPAASKALHDEIARLSELDF